MKKLSTTLLIISFFNLVQSQIVTIPDQNFLKILKREGVDKNNDGFIQVSEAEAITKLDALYYYGGDQVSSFEGIDAFINLEYLNCSDHKISSLDLSSNLKLKKLDCWQNYNLTSLNLSKNSQLEYLNCRSGNLTQLNVENTNLKQLICYLNKITDLDLTSLSLLDTLDCSDNSLNSLNVSYNTNLTYLSCGRNYLSQLYLNDNEQLKNLYCGYNQLKELNISNNLLLDTIYCYRNQLLSLDVSLNINLKSLYALNNSTLKKICISQSQLNNKVINWSKDASVLWSTDNCLVGLLPIKLNRSKKILGYRNLLGQPIILPNKQGVYFIFYDDDTVEQNYIVNF